MKKLTQGLAEHNKAMAAAKSDEAKNDIVSLFLGASVVGDFLSMYLTTIFSICRKLRSRMLLLACGPAITF